VTAADRPRYVQSLPRENGWWPRFRSQEFDLGLTMTCPIVGPDRHRSLQWSHRAVVSSQFSLSSVHCSHFQLFSDNSNSSSGFVPLPKRVFQLNSTRIFSATLISVHVFILSFDIRHLNFAYTLKQQQQQQPTPSIALVVRQSFRSLQSKILVSELTRSDLDLDPEAEITVLSGLWAKTSAPAVSVTTSTLRSCLPSLRSNRAVGEVRRPTATCPVAAVPSCASTRR